MESDGTTPAANDGEALLSAADQETARERWSKRLTVARGVLVWAGGRARPVANAIQEGATQTG
eukprot:CAMPEP_0173471226 /NCGR_PEP_ID=MMETSP1357-20121228/78288_1 /TAXON_ID=77926 /ORGANISM="Hemiselmis rufescens, Strain PCC563" /LENGTH=62 /DNA_ID=CAMNT_0014439531 /DNA_START=618 /DNA_END=803 /DNA_ORIENTATION=-